MKKLRLFFGAAFIIAIGSAFATKPVNHLVDNPYWLRSDCSNIALPVDCQGGNKTCTFNDEPIYQGTTCTSSSLVQLHP